MNPWIGCTKVSAGCAHCYAESQDHRWGNDSWGPGKIRRVTSVNYWRQPLLWAKDAAKAGVRRRVFCASMADVFDAEAPVDFRRNLWSLIGETCQYLDWLICTKRPERIISVMDDDYLNAGFFELCKCWLLTTVENQENEDRIEALCEVDALVHGISAEPLLGPLAIEPYLVDWAGKGGMINWVIVGGESGQKARPCDVAWVRSIVDQCKDAEVPVFVKQMGDYSTRVDPTDDVRGPVTKRILWQKRAGSDPAEWPADLQVRQFPIP
jgi:protein gp37